MEYMEVHPGRGLNLYLCFHPVDKDAELCQLHLVVIIVFYELECNMKLCVNC